MITNYRTDKIVEHFGQDFNNKVLDFLPEIQSKWKLSEIDFIESYSANMVLQGISKEHGKVVLKFGRFEKEFKNEVKALKDFEGDKTCKILEMDEANHVILQSFLSPGTQLKEESLEVRLDVFISLFKAFHMDQVYKAYDESHNYPSYKNWMDNIASFMEKVDEWKEVQEHLKLAMKLFNRLWQKYDDIKLLHGDFHYYNILKHDTDYLMIDPKGVLGPICFDLPRYMLNEYWDAEVSERENVINTMFKTFHEALGFDQMELGQLLYIEGVLAQCWNIEDGVQLEDKNKFLLQLNDLKIYI